MLIPAGSTQYLLIPFSGPSGTTWPALDVELALVADDASEPETTDWVTGTWIGDEGAMLVVAGAYPAGDYMAWARLTAGVERPVLKAGRVRIGG